MNGKRTSIRRFDIRTLSRVSAYNSSHNAKRPTYKDLMALRQAC